MRSSRSGFVLLLTLILMTSMAAIAGGLIVTLTTEFRAAKIPVAESFSKDSLRTQLNTADKMKIKWVLIFGQKEALEGFITLRDMETGVQKEIKLNKVVQEMKNKVKS